MKKRKRLYSILLYSWHINSYLKRFGPGQREALSLFLSLSLALSEVLRAKFCLSSFRQNLNVLPERSRHSAVCLILNQANPKVNFYFGLGRSNDWQEADSLGNPSLHRCLCIRGSTSTFTSSSKKDVIEQQTIVTWWALLEQSTLKYDMETVANHDEKKKFQVLLLC